MSELERPSGHVRLCRCDECDAVRLAWQARFAAGDRERDVYAAATGGRNLFLDRLSGGERS